MKKRPSHRVQRRFSGECCVKNTQTAAAEKSTPDRTTKTGRIVIYQMLIETFIRYNLKVHFGRRRLRVALAAPVSSGPSEKAP